MYIVFASKTDNKMKTISHCTNCSKILIENLRKKQNRYPQHTTTLSWLGTGTSIKSGRDNKRYRKQKGYARMNNPEKLTTLCTQDTGRRHTSKNNNTES